MRRTTAIAAALLLLCLGSLASATISIPTVLVSDPGNAGELSGSGAGGTGPSRICGSVGYSYRMGRYEVTAGQYTAFLNATAATDTYGLYHSNMAECGITRSGISGSYTYSVASDFINRPISYVSYWDAVRFANWLQNHQPIGLQNASTTEDGSYFINGYNGADGHTIQRKPGANWLIPSEDEWYKAAYYKRGGTNAGYWDYPTKSDTISTSMANYAGSIGHTTGMGSYSYPSAYSTYDQGGNVGEWNESIVHQGVGYEMRDVRGGSYGSIVDHLQASYRSGLDYLPTNESDRVGFRVTYIVPEPSSLVALAGGAGLLLGLRRRKV